MNTQKDGVAHQSIVPDDQMLYFTPELGIRHPQVPKVFPGTKHLPECGRFCRPVPPVSAEGEQALRMISSKDK
jgi:hypothetical protein